MTREEVENGSGAYAYISPYPASRPYVWLHEHTGDDYQSIADDAATWASKNQRQSSDLQEQALYYQHIHNDLTTPTFITPNVVNNGGGSGFIIPDIPQTFTA